MRALVTGAAGFIGSHLVDLLLAEGWEVIALDNCATGRWDNLGIAKPSQALQLERTEREGLWAIQAAVEDGCFWGFPECDAVFHLAGHVGVDHVLQARTELLREAGSVWELLEWARQVDARVILTSTSEVYGSSAFPLSEYDMALICGPQTARGAYAAAKLYVEHVALALHAQDKLRVTVVRPFNVSGPRQRPDNVIPRWLHAAAAGEPIVVHGGGTYERAFTHVADFVRALVALVTCPATIGQVVNIGQADEVITVAALAALVADTAASYGHRTTIDILREGCAGAATGWDRFKARQPNVALLRQLAGITVPARTIDIVRDTAEWAYGRK